MALGTFEKDDFPIKIYPPTFPSISAAYAYFTRNADKFQDDFEDDDDNDFAVDNPYTDIHDIIENVDSRPLKSTQADADGQHEEPPTDEGTEEGEGDESSTIAVD